jgi:hypothetical protein
LAADQRPGREFSCPGLFEEHIRAALDHFSNAATMPRGVMQADRRDIVDKHPAAAFDVLPCIGAAAFAVDPMIAYP